MLQSSVYSFTYLLKTTGGFAPIGQTLPPPVSDEDSGGMRIFPMGNKSIYLHKDLLTFIFYCIYLLFLFNCIYLIVY